MDHFLYALHLDGKLPEKDILDPGCAVPTIYRDLKLAEVVVKDILTDRLRGRVTIARYCLFDVVGEKYTDENY